MVDHLFEVIKAENIEIKFCKFTPDENEKKYVRDTFRSLNEKAGKNSKIIAAFNKHGEIITAYFELKHNGKRQFAWEEGPNIYQITKRLKNKILFQMEGPARYSFILPWKTGSEIFY